jgi:hypothetical protein
MWLIIGAIAAIILAIIIGVAVAESRASSSATKNSGGGGGGGGGGGNSPTAAPVTSPAAFMSEINIGTFTTADISLTEINIADIGTVIQSAGNIVGLVAERVVGRYLRLNRYN